MRGGRLRTLPDYLRPSLDLVFVGINPGTLSARLGHYYARPGNLFWWALHASGLVSQPMTPTDDRRLPEFGIGLTDVVKRPSDGAADIEPREFRTGARALVRRLTAVRPRLVCFNGLTGYRHGFDRWARPGLQPVTLAGARVFVVPSTSRRNAAYGREAVLRWFMELRRVRDRSRAEPRRRPASGRPRARPDQ